MHTELSMTSSWIDGGQSSSNRTFAIMDPSRGVEIGRAFSAATADVDRAVAAARNAYVKHRGASPGARSDWCYSASAEIRKNEDRLAQALSEEHGKPLSEALAEVRSAAQGFRTAAEVVMGDPGESPRLHDANKRISVNRDPLGVWAVITPWNFPLNIPVEYLGPALSTGNAVIWKPAPTTSRIAALMHEVLRASDLPSELLQLILTNELEVAQHLTTHPGVDAVGFTGGSATGRSIEQACWDKHLLLELGGNTTIAVFEDADIEQAAAAIASAGFWNGGQVCSAAGRVLVADSIVDRLSERIVEHARALVVGDPLHPDTTLGALHLESSIARIQSLVDDALERGAHCLEGGSPLPGQGNYYPPTVLIDVPAEAAIFSEETFGPVLPIVRCGSEAELMELAEEGDYGLVAAVFTQHIGRAYRASERLRAGLVVVNDSSNFWELGIAFGGAPGTRSGRGRLGGRYALEEFTTAKSIVLDIG